jgi:hypothetical protein
LKPQRKYHSGTFSFYVRDDLHTIVITGKSKSNGPFERPSHQWDDNIRMDLGKIVWEFLWTRFIWLRIWTSDNETSRSIKGEIPLD